MKTIQKPYKPKGMVEAEENQRFYHQGQLALAQIAMKMKKRQFPDMMVMQQNDKMGADSENQTE